jgi:predicted transcriptional regulator
MIGSMATAITTVLDDEIIAELDALGHGQTREMLVAEAVRWFVEERSGWTRKLDDARASIAAGGGVSHQQFTAEVRRWREERGLPGPSSA